MRFDFDPAKSRANKAKHGIDFEEAQALWNDPDYVEFPADSRTETRFQVIGRIGGPVWSAFITYRYDSNTDERICRLISVRKARRNEQRAYLERGGEAPER